MTPRLLDPEDILEPFLAREQHTAGSYQFENVLPQTYLLDISHRSVRVQQQLVVADTTQIQVVFPEEHHLSYRLMDRRGLFLEDATLQVERETRSLVYERVSSSGDLLLPPGTYTFSVTTDAGEVGKRSLLIQSDCSRDLITSAEPWYPFLFLLIIVGGAAIGILQSIRKQAWMHVFLIASMGLLLDSFLFPWWSLSGATKSVETASTLYLLPFQLVSITADETFVVGVLETLPDLLVLMQQSLVVLLGAALVFVMLSMVLCFHKKKMLAGSIVCSAVCLGVFSYGISEYVRVGVGGLVGQNTIEVIVAGSSAQYMVEVMWGPTGGFVCVLAALVIQIGLLLWLLRKKR